MHSILVHLGRRWRGMPHLVGSSFTAQIAWILWAITNKITACHENSANCDHHTVGHEWNYYWLSESVNPFGSCFCCVINWWFRHRCITAAKGSRSLTSSLAATDVIFFWTASIAWKKIHRFHDTIFEHFFSSFSSSSFPYLHCSSSVFFIFFFLRSETFPFHFAFFGFRTEDLNFLSEILKKSSSSSEFSRITQNTQQITIFQRKIFEFLLHYSSMKK